MPKKHPKHHLHLIFVVVFMMPIICITGTILKMDPTNRRTYFTKTSGATNSFKGSPEAIRVRLNKAQAIAQGLNRQLGNLLHFIQQSSYLAIEARDGQPQEILWVVSKKVGSSSPDHGEKILRYAQEEGLGKLPTGLRGRLPEIVDKLHLSRASNALGKDPSLDNVPVSKGWSYEVLLLSADKEIVPEATITYPAVRLNEDGDICFIADVCPLKIEVPPQSGTASKEYVKKGSMAGDLDFATPAASVSTAVKEKISIDVVQLFWDALKRAGAEAKISLDVPTQDIS